METLEKHILQLEKDLLKPEIRGSVEKTGELLSEGFIEFCSSGYEYHYKKGDSIDKPNNLEQINWKIIDFSIDQLSDDCILATYKLIKDSNLNENKKYSLRSSIWKSFDGKWKMFFHQGTQMILK